MHEKGRRVPVHFQKKEHAENRKFFQEDTL